MMWLVSHFSMPGGNVLDLCCGTGSTTIAALALGRNCIAVDTEKLMLETLAVRVAKLQTEAEAEPTPTKKKSSKATKSIKGALQKKKKGQKKIRPIMRPSKSFSSFLFCFYSSLSFQFSFFFLFLIIVFLF